MIPVTSAPPDLTGADLARLAELVTRRAGLALTESRWPFLRNRARQVIARSGFVSVGRWLSEVEASAERRGALYCDLEEALQVHETSFFRYPAHHRVLGERLLPTRLRKGGPRIRILVVGCATGEEAYSVAMTVRESLPALTPCPVEVLGLDVSRPALAVAVRGSYPASRVAAVPPACVTRYFAGGPDEYTVGPGLRQMVRFRHHDVRRGLYIGKFDAIFCCNVLLYFTPAMKAEMLARLGQSLAEGGYLFLGHAEGIAPPADAFETLPESFTYRQVARSAAWTGAGAVAPGGLRHG